MNIFRIFPKFRILKKILNKAVYDPFSDYLKTANLKSIYLLFEGIYLSVLSCEFLKLKIWEIVYACFSFACCIKSFDSLAIGEPNLP